MHKQMKCGRFRLFINLPPEIYTALMSAVKQNYCTKTEYVIRSLIKSFQQDAIMFAPRDTNKTLIK